MINFVAIDLERATSNHNSACALGLVQVCNSRITQTKNWLIKPPDNYYEDRQTSYHRISSGATKNSPLFPEVWTEAASLIGDNLVVAHNAASADISYIRKSSSYHGYHPKVFNFVCTLEMSKIVWPEKMSYGLKELAHTFDIELIHHDPLSDAIATAKLALLICQLQNADTLEEGSNELGCPPRIFSEIISNQQHRGNTSRFSPIGTDNDNIGTANIDFRGAKVLVTGKMPYKALNPRKKAKPFIERCNGVFTEKTSKDVKYLLKGEQHGEAKLQFAKKNNLEIIVASDFFHRNS